ncbi:MAG: O-antigen polymerase [Caulobacteraceae bacterium]
MPILRLFLALMALGALGPLFFVFSAKRSEFLIVSLGLQAEVLPALALLGLGALGFCGGYGAQRLRPARPGAAGPEASFTLGLAFWALCVAAILALMGGSAGAILRNTELLLSKVRGVTANQNLIFSILTVAVFQACLLALSAIDRPGRRRVTGAVLVVLATSVLAFSVGNRLQSIFVLLVPALAMGGRGRLRLSMLAPPAIVGLVLVYAGDMIRRAAQGGDPRNGEGLFATFAAAFSQLDPMAVAVQLAERVPTSALESLKALILWPVPHTMILHKALVAPLVARYLYFGDTLGGITLGMFGEYYYYFGLIGLVLLAFASGWVSSWLARRAAGGASISHHVALVAVSMLMLSSLRDGVFNDMLNYVTLAGFFAFHRLTAMAVEAAGHRAPAPG